ncbi:hypothetical protein [Streptomyces sp. N1]|uniref:hypothetical protein n=1 Tax=Streptomyces sp. N1 TaxID=576456 RepID=UPI0013E940DB|nr:hypothetical protein [Streptomyces sp. N1]
MGDVRDEPARGPYAGLTPPCEGGQHLGRIDLVGGDRCRVLVGEDEFDGTGQRELVGVDDVGGEGHRAAVREFAHQAGEGLGGGGVGDDARVDRDPGGVEAHPVLRDAGGQGVALFLLAHEQQVLRPGLRDQRSDEGVGVESDRGEQQALARVEAEFLLHPCGVSSDPQHGAPSSTVHGRGCLAGVVS